MGIIDTLSKCRNGFKLRMRCLTQSPFGYGFYVVDEADIGLLHLSVKQEVLIGRAGSVPVVHP